MSSKQVVLRVPITELPMLVEGKSKQTALNDKPKLMSLPITDLSYPKPTKLLPGFLPLPLKWVESKKKAIFYTK